MTLECVSCRYPSTSSFAQWSVPDLSSPSSYFVNLNRFMLSSSLFSSSSASVALLSVVLWPDIICQLRKCFFFTAVCTSKKFSSWQLFFYPSLASIWSLFFTFFPLVSFLSENSLSLCFTQCWLVFLSSFLHYMYLACWLKDLIDIIIEGTPLCLLFYFWPSYPKSLYLDCFPVCWSWVARKHRNVPEAVGCFLARILLRLTS